MIHPSSDIQTRNIGKGTIVWQFCVILPNAIIGEDCNINSNVFIENDVKIGSKVTIKCGVQLWDGIILEDAVFVGPNVTFTNDSKPRSKQYPDSYGRTIVRKGASLGANSTILPNIVIGEFAMIGAGSVVTKNILPHALVVGNPAEHVGWVNKQGIRLVKKNDDYWQDELTGEVFQATSKGLIKK